MKIVFALPLDHVFLDKTATIQAVLIGIEAERGTMKIETDNGTLSKISQSANVIRAEWKPKEQGRANLTVEYLPPDTKDDGKLVGTVGRQEIQVRP